MSVQSGVQPNQYELHHGSVKVTYSLLGPTGPSPHLAYENGGQTRTFDNDQIVTTETPIGTLVTVTLEMVPDAESTLFSVLLPSVDLGGGNTGVGNAASAVSTFAVTTVRRTSLFGPVSGQVESYKVSHELEGTASVVQT